MKKIVSFILALSVICSAFGVSAARGGGFEYEINGDFISLTADNDYRGTVAAGVYNADGALIDAKMFYDEVFYGGQEKKLSTEGMKTEGADSVRVFLFDDVKTLKPGEIISFSDADYNAYSVDGSTFSGSFTEESDIAGTAVFKVIDESLNEVSSGSFSAADGKYSVSLSASGIWSDSHAILYICDANGNIKRKYSLDYDKAPTAAAADKMIADMAKKTAILKKLLDECRDAGISTDYETLNYRVCERFCIYMAEDKQCMDYRRLLYTYEECSRLFEESAKAMESYLDGTKTAFSVPHYVTSDVEADGSALIAETETDGVRTRRPVYFVGYGHFTQAKNDIPVFNDFGANTVQQEIGPSDIMKNPIVWDIAYNNGAAENGVTAVVATSPKKSGEYALRVSYPCDTLANRYVTISQTVKLKPNTAYEYGLEANTLSQADNAEIWYSINNWDDRKQMRGNGWQSYRQTYTTSVDEETHTFRITVDGKVKRLGIDDTFVREVGTDENLLKNPGFESDPNAEYFADAEEIENTVNMLKSAEENNIAVNLLLSPHYFPGFLYEKHPEIKNSATGGYIYSHPTLRSIIEEYLRLLLPQLADCKAIKSLCLMNEPSVQAADCDYYKTEWAEYLEKKYGSISLLNAAYGTSYSSFGGVPMHSSDDGSVMYRDYWYFNCGILTDFHKFMADIIREYMPDTPLHTKFQWYVGSKESEFRNRWNLGTNHEELSDFLDYNGCDAAYYWRYCRNGWEEPLYPSIWFDYLRGVKNAPIVNSEAHIIQDGDQNFNPMQAYFSANGIWQGAIHGNAISDIWVWAREQSDRSGFWGSVLFRPDVIAEIGKTSLDLNRLSYEVKAVADEPSKIALLYSDYSRLYNEEWKYNTTKLYSAYETLLFGGLKPGIVTEKSIERIVTDGNIKVLALPGVHNISKAALFTIRDFVVSGGKVIILGTDGSVERDDQNAEFSGDALAAANMIRERAVVLDALNDSASKNAFVAAAEDEVGRLVEVVYADSGSRVAETEYTYGFSADGDLLINICDYDLDSRGSKDIEIKVNGKAAGGMTELRSGRTYTDGTVGITPYSPLLIRIDKSEFTLDRDGRIIVPAEGDTAEICTATIKNSDGNVVFIGQSSTPADGRHTISYTLGNFDPNAEYTVNIGGANGYMYSERIK